MTSEKFPGPAADNAPTFTSYFVPGINIVTRQHSGCSGWVGGHITGCHDKTHDGALPCGQGMFGHFGSLTSEHIGVYPLQFVLQVVY